MRRALTIALAAAVALAAVASVTPPATAQQDGPAMLVGGKDERAALKAMRADKLVRARELAEKVLDRQPDSFIATYVLARAFHYEESNLPRALFLLRKARRLLEKRFGAEPEVAMAQRWHREVLMDLNWLYGEMDRPEDRLRLLHEYARLYNPPHRDLRMWPLMKLRRFDEARALGRELTRSDDLHERVRGYNGLIATEAEAMLRTATWRMGQEALEATQRRTCIIAHNMSASALAVFRFDDAEQLAKEALKAEYQDCSHSSYSRLATLYLVEAEFQKAISALESLRKVGIEKRYREQFEMSNRAQLAELLYALGQLEKAEEFARAVFQAPDRTGMTSSSAADLKLGAAVTLGGVLDARLAQQAERMSARALGDRVDHGIAAVSLSVERWEVARKAVQLAAVGDTLPTVVRPYMKAVVPWQVGSLIGLLGGGVMAKAVRAARELEEELPAAHAFLDGLEGEVAWRDGDLGAARRLGESALEGVPREAATFRLRVSAWLADVRWRQGEAREAVELWHTVLQRLPSALRMLGLAIPATLVVSDDAAAREVADRLRGSPRLKVVGEGEPAFTVDVYRDGDGLHVCLREARGFSFGCADEATLQAPPRRGQAPAKAPEGDRVARMIDAFHDKVLAPKVSLTSSDINSLDGSPVRVDADQVLDNVLGGGQR